MWPGWNDLEAIKTVSSRVADITVGFWVAMAVLEILAVFPTRFKKRLAGAGLVAFLLAVSGEVAERRYEHRKDALYEEHEANTARQLNAKIDAANTKAQAAQALNDAAERNASAAQKTAQAAQAEADVLRREQAPRALTPEQQRKLSSYLSKCPSGAFEINASINENDARPYAEQIASIFRNTGWQVKINNSMFTGPDVSGLWLTIQDPKRPPQTAVDLYNALTAAGVSSRVQYDPTFTAPVPVTLSIGFKPKAAFGKR